MVLDGKDPLVERRAKRKGERELARGLTFREVGDLYLEAHSPGWRNKVHRWQWAATLETHAYPVLGDLPVSAIGVAEIMRVLEPIWYRLPETASRLRGRIEAVLSYASARTWRQGDNPARWRGHLETLLPARDELQPVAHMAALPWADLPALWTELADRQDASALALRFCLLTATRTNEVLSAQWSEIDLKAKVWTIPGERMKAGREFRVPLTDTAVAVLNQLAAIRQNDYVFPGRRHGQPLSNMAMLMVLRRLRPGAGKITVHGTTRSGFRDWAAEHGVSRELAEAALAHVLENKSEAAYRRGDLLEPRRRVMQRWAAFLIEPAGQSEVIPLAR
jgi:integrase